MNAGGILIVMSLGNRIRDERLRIGMTQKELAARTSVSPQVISNWERDYTLPDLEDVARISGIFGCSIDYLLGHEVSRTQSVSAAQGPIKVPLGVVVEPEVQTFAEWVKENVGPSFFYDFEDSPEESREQLLADLKYLWEREKKQRERKSQKEEK